MKAMSYADARANLAKTMDAVRDDCEPVIITRSRDTAYVLMTLDHYSSLEETAHLLRSPANAEALRRSIEQIERGEVVSVKIDLDAAGRPLLSRRA